METMKNIIKGIAAAVLIGAAFFLFKQRMPQIGDITGMISLTAICIAGSTVKIEPEFDEELLADF